MSAPTDSPEVCVWSVETHHFDNISVKCVFKCRNPGYKTYSGLHNHYLNVHKICLHRVAHLDPNNENEFRRQVTSILTPLVGGSANLQASPRGRKTSHPTQPPLASSSSQLAGPSHFRDYQTPGDTTFHPTLTSLVRDNLSSSPSWHPTPIPIGSPYQNHSPSSRPPVLGEVGPSRSSATYQTARHQPYPQSQHQQQGLHPNHSPIRGQAEGEGREIPSTVINHHLLTPNTPSQGLQLFPSALEYSAPSNTPCEPAPSTIRPYNGTFVGSPRDTSAGPPHSRSQQVATQTLTTTQWTPAPRYPIDAMVPGNFRQPATTQEDASPVDSPRESEAPIPVVHTRPMHPQLPQLQTTVVGSCGPVMYLPTPPMGTNHLPGGSPSPSLLDQPSRSPWRVNQEPRLESLTPPAAGTPSTRRGVQQPVYHPYPRPANGSTSLLVRQAREVRQQGSPTEAEVAMETFSRISPSLVEGRTRAVVTPDRHWEQDHTGKGTPDPLEVQKKETTVLLANRQGRLISLQAELAPSHVRPLSGHALSQPEPTSVARSTIRPASATASEGRTQPHVPRQGVQSLDESSVTLREPGLPEPSRSAQTQDLSGPVEQRQTIGESTSPVIVVQESNQASEPEQRHNLDKCHPTKTANGEGETSRQEVHTQDPFPDISWEGWGLIRTSEGAYLPETFNPSPHIFQDLTDQW